MQAQQHTTINKKWIELVVSNLTAILRPATMRVNGDVRFTPKRLNDACSVTVIVMQRLCTGIEMTIEAQVEECQIAAENHFRAESKLQWFKFRERNVERNKFRMLQQRIVALRELQEKLKYLTP